MGRKFSGHAGQAERDGNTQKNHLWLTTTGVELGSAWPPYSLAHQPLPTTGDQSQGGQATLFQGIVMAKHCVGLVGVGGTQGEMAKSGEAERN